jgi:RHS repeat-associated protein
MHSITAIRRAPHLVGLALVALVTLVGAAPAWAQTAQESGFDTTVQGYSGTFTTRVPISVPGYRGLEPKMSLVYVSSSANGPLGVGWGLTGSSLIERANAGRGAPKWDGNDIFVLDGTPLVPNCTTFGGTHCTRIESYTRITWDGANNRWYVWTKDGHKATYTALLTTTSGTFRWALSSVQDTRSNTVSYSYWCDGTPVKDCYLDTVTYNGTTIKLYYETRTDTVKYAMGAPPAGVATCNDLCWNADMTATIACNLRPCETLAQTAYRLKTIDVKVGTSRARAYKLTYGTSANSGRSVLASVQQFGTDATVSSGTVTGGTSLPALTVGTTAPVNTFGQWDWNSGANWSGYDIVPGDFNGDGKLDFLRHGRYGTSLPDYLCLSSGTSFTCTLVASAGAWNNWGVLVGDFNGDGKSDIYLHALVTGTTDRMGLSTGSGFTQWTWTSGADWASYKVTVGDFNGDGKTDILRTGYDANYYQAKWLALSTGSSFTQWTWTWNSGVYSYDGCPNPNIRVGDFNGDGKDDIVEYRGEGGCWMDLGGFGSLTWQDSGIFVSLATGTGFEVNTWSLATEQWYATTFLEPNGYAYSRVIVGDFNADGKADLLLAPANNWYSQYGSTYTNGPVVALSQGRAFQKWSWVPGNYDWRNYEIHAADFNGDGRTDLYLHGSKDSGLFDYMGLSDGTGFAMWTWSQTSSSWASYDLAPGDFNGDGKADIIISGRKDTGLYTYLGLSSPSGGLPDLMSSIANGIGGSTTVTYTPSSAWTNTMVPAGQVFPTASSVTVNDGRSDVQATNYAYQGARFNVAEREFLGFRRVTTTLASTGAYAETYYWQRVGTIAKPEVIYKKKANGGIMSFEKFVFTEDTSPPYTSLATQIWSYECNGDGVVDANNNYVSGCKRRYTGYTYDAYANMTREDQYGDYDLSGDERTAVRSFAVNTSAYIVGYPAWEEIRAGIGTGGTLLKRARFLYDGATTEGTAPTVGNLTKQLEWNDQTGGYEGVTNAYDGYGNLTTVTDAAGGTTSRAFDTTRHLYLTSVTNALTHVATGEFDALGRLTRSVDTNGGASTLSYDAMGRLTLAVSPDGAQVAKSFVSFGSPSAQRERRSQWDPTLGDWNWADTYFDGVGRPYLQVDRAGTRVETIYGPSGKVWKKSLPYASGDTVRYNVVTYDEVGRTLTETKPDGTAFARSYGDGYTAVTDEAGQTTTAWFDAWGRATKVRQVIGGVNRDTTHAYDLLGRETRIVDALGNTTAKVYSSRGRLLQRSDPDAGLWVSTYDAAGRMTRQTDAAGKVTTLAYDALGRITRRTYHDGTYDTLAYDEAGRGASKGHVTSTSSASGVTTAASYDSMGRLTSGTTTVDGTGYTFQYTYDVAGRLATTTYPDGEVVTNSYGTSGLATGQLVGVTGSTAGTIVSAATYGAGGRLLSSTAGNGVTTTITADAYTMRTASIAVGSVATLSYAYDATGRVTSLTSNQLASTNWTYQYDEIGRLTRAANQLDGAYTYTYRYDAVGRMLCNNDKGTYSYPADGQARPHGVTAAGADTYAYDANGNMTSGGGRTITYGLDYRPTSIVYGGNTTTFRYAADGTRVKKTGPNGTVITIGDYEKRGTAVTKYYRAGGQRLAKRDANGNQFLHVDQLGSTRLITDQSGALAQRYEYAPFGKVILGQGSRPDSHRFTGQEADDETGLMYYRARYYDPALGRFLSPDPIMSQPLNPQDLDAYAYVYNNPVNLTDPSGCGPIGIVFAVIGAIGTGSAVIIALTVIGAILSFTNSPILQTIGALMMGIASIMSPGFTPLLGLSLEASKVVTIAVTLATSPLSPLDPTIKKIIGWAFTAWSIVSTIHWEVEKAKLKDAPMGNGGSSPTTRQPGDIIVNEGAGATIRPTGEVNTQGQPTYDVIFNGQDGPFGGASDRHALFGGSALYRHGEVLTPTVEGVFKTLAANHINGMTQIRTAYGFSLGSLNLSVAVWSGQLVPQSIKLMGAPFLYAGVVLKPGFGGIPVTDYRGAGDLWTWGAPRIEGAKTVTLPHIGHNGPAYCSAAGC